MEHSVTVRKWVEEKTFLRNVGKNLPSLTPERHRAAIEWLRAQGRPASGGGGAVSLVTLMFWAVRENFASLYEMILCNAINQDMALSATCIGLVFCPTLAMFNHDCVPNAVLAQTPQGYTLTATTDIQAGDEICYSYLVEAVGLLSDNLFQHQLLNRFGFSCKCPTHLGTRPMYRKRVRNPASLAVLYYQNRLLDAEMEMLEKYYQRERWDKVREVCEMLATGFFPLIKSEPRLAFTISYRYAMTVPFCVPSAESDKWLMLFVAVVTQFCTNPAFIARAFFLYLFHTVRKLNVLAWNPTTNTQEHVFPGCHGADLDLFLINYINLRACLRNMVPVQVEENSSTFQRIIMAESCLFSGLRGYLDIMESTVRDAERDIQALNIPRKSRSESLNLTNCDFVRYDLLMHALSGFLTRFDDR
jgi:hypothetical protein